MATRKGGSRLETEIERCRSECQWERIPELVKQLSAKLIANVPAKTTGTRRLAGGQRFWSSLLSGFPELLEDQRAHRQVKEQVND